MKCKQCQNGLVEWIEDGIPVVDDCYACGGKGEIPDQEWLERELEEWSLALAWDMRWANADHINPEDEDAYLKRTSSDVRMQLQGLSPELLKALFFRLEDK